MSNKNIWVPCCLRRNWAPKTALQNLRHRHKNIFRNGVDCLERERKDPFLIMPDDDEWIRSFPRTQSASRTTKLKWTLRRFDPYQDGGVPAKVCLQATPGAQRKSIRDLDSSIAKIRWWFPWRSWSFHHRRTLDTQLPRIKVDDKTCFGMIECRAARNSAISLSPTQQWLVGNIVLSSVELEGVVPKDRGAE